jgi:nucleoside-diphosphate-sugar epimerase
MILVTGGTGLLGSHLLFYLSKSGESIKAIYRSKEKKNKVREVFSFYTDDVDFLFDRIEWVRGDILDVVFFDSALKGITKVYHLAAIVAFDRSTEKWMNKVNVEGTANVVNLCLANNVQKLCHVSSVATISKPVSNTEANESDFWNPDAVNSGYAISKNGAEMEVWRGVEEGLNAVIVNPSIIIGPGFWESSSGKLFSTVEKGMKFYTNGGSGFVGVDDVAKVMVKLMESDVVSERFIINSENLPFRDVFSRIALSLNLKPPKIEAKKWMLSFAWRLDVIKSSLFGAEQRLNKDSARSAINVSKYSNKKAVDELGVSFTPIDRVIMETAKIFRSK